MPQTVVRHESEHLYAERPPKTPEGRALAEAVLHLRRAERVQADRALAVSGLSNLDLTALRYLVQGYRDGRNLSPKDLIVMLDTSSATVTNVVDRLVHREYVTRVQHPHDRRAHYLVPTEAAIHRVDDAFGAHHSTLVSVIDGLPPEVAKSAASAISQIAEAFDQLAAAQLRPQTDTPTA